MSETRSISTLSKGSQLALSRTQVYLFLARAFQYPREPLLEYLESALESLNFLGYGDIALALEPLTNMGHSMEDRRADYRQVFGHTLNSDFPPYEIEYGNTTVYQQSGGLSDVAAFYKSCGLESTPEERLDHIGVELEFMYFLTFKEAYASQHHGEDKVQTCRAMQKRFLETHLGCWSPLFFRLVQRKSISPFYQVMASVSREFLDSEVQLLGAKPKLLAETDFNPQAMKLKNEAVWNVKDCGEDCI